MKKNGTTQFLLSLVPQIGSHIQETLQAKNKYQVQSAMRILTIKNESLPIVTKRDTIEGLKVRILYVMFGPQVNFQIVQKHLKF